MSESERIRQNVENIIHTKKGEVRYDIDLGINQDYIDKPVKEVTSALITDIVDSVEQYEPRVTVNPDDIITLVEGGEQSFVLKAKEEIE